MAFAETLLARSGKISMIFIAIVWAFTILLVIDTKMNYRDVKKRSHCHCNHGDGNDITRKETPKKEVEEKIETKTVVKWLTYCRKERKTSDGTRPSRSKSKMRGHKKAPVINPHPYKFTINNPDACLNGANADGYVDALCLVLTAPGESYSRSLIRSTWGSAKVVKGKRIVTMFLLGQRDEETQYLLEMEDNHYHDIIQENFYDSYYNLTLKTLMGLKWASQFCPNARYVLKVDVDMFLNVFNLVDRMETAPTSNFAEGFLKPITKPIRDRQSKWYTSKAVYPNDTYPTYFDGPSYFMTGDLTSRIFRVSMQTPFLPWEDAFTGICMHKIKVDLHHSDRFGIPLNFRDERGTLSKINDGIAFNLGADKDENKDNFKLVWNRVRLLNDIPVLEGRE